MVIWSYGQTHLILTRISMKQSYHIPLLVSISDMIVDAACVCVSDFFNECIRAHTNVCPPGCELENF